MVGGRDAVWPASELRRDLEHLAERGRRREGTDGSASPVLSDLLDGSGSVAHTHRWPCCLRPPCFSRDCCLAARERPEVGRRTTNLETLSRGSRRGFFVSAKD